jgi:hypothetical protein
MSQVDQVAPLRLVTRTSAVYATPQSLVTWYVTAQTRVGAAVDGRARSTPPSAVVTASAVAVRALAVFVRVDMTSPIIDATQSTLRQGRPSWPGRARSGRRFCPNGHCVTG